MGHKPLFMLSLENRRKKVHKHGPQILIHIHELDFSGRQVHKHGP